MEQQTVALMRLGKSSIALAVPPWIVEKLRLEKGAGVYVSWDKRSGRIAVEPVHRAKERRPHGYWKNKEHRIRAVREMVEKTGLPPSRITAKEFIAAGLQAVIHHCGNSPIRALEEAGYTIAYYGPGKKKQVPQRHWDKRENRIAAVRWLVEHLGKAPSQVTVDDFRECELTGLFDRRMTVRAALREAGYDVPTWHKAPPHYWDDREHRVRAIRRMVQLTGGRPEAITNKTFRAFHLTGVLSQYYRSIRNALKDAGYRVEEFSKRPQGFWHHRKNRIEAVREMVTRSGKPIEEITVNDFREAGIMCVINVCGSILAALGEAGYAMKPWERRPMPTSSWQSKEHRVAATRWLVEKIGKKPLEINQRDFMSHGLGRLLKAYSRERCASYERGDLFTDEPGYLLKYPTRVTRALVEAGFDIKIEDLAGARRWKGGGISRYWKERERRIAVIRKVVDELGDPRKVSRRHFIERGVTGLLKYYASLEEALKDAGYPLHPWERSRVPNRYWLARENRIKAVRWLVEKIGGNPRKIMRRDFREAGIEGLLSPAGGVLGAVKEAGYDLKPWEYEHMRPPRDTWASRENRAAAVKWLLASLMKEPSEVSRRDFRLLGLSRLANEYGIPRLLEEAGCEVDRGMGRKAPAS
ncbi:MAG: hypothetical protein AB1665_00120 [Candidatus Thermoplasmatota archaeon]